MCVSSIACDTLTLKKQNYRLFICYSNVAEHSLFSFAKSGNSSKGQSQKGHTICSSPLAQDANSNAHGCQEAALIEAITLQQSELECCSEGGSHHTVPANCQQQNCQPVSLGSDFLRNVRNLEFNVCTSSVCLLRINSIF